MTVSCLPWTSQSRLSLRLVLTTPRGRRDLFLEDVCPRLIGYMPALTMLICSTTDEASVGYGRCTSRRAVSSDRHAAGDARKSMSAWVMISVAVILPALLLPMILLVALMMTGCATVERGAVAPGAVTFQPATSLHVEPGAVTLSVAPEAVHIEAPVTVPMEPVGTGLQVIGDGISQAALMVGEQAASRADARVADLVAAARAEWHDTRSWLMLVLWCALGVALLAVLLLGVGEYRRDVAAARRAEK